MLPEKITKQIIADFKKFKPEKIILFGSSARGDYDESSDIDLIIVYKTRKRFMNRLKDLYMAWKLPKAVDILAYTPKEFNTMLRESIFIQDIMAEGLTLYEKSG